MRVPGVSTRYLPRSSCVLMFTPYALGIPGWKRNIGFVISTVYSIHQAYFAGSMPLHNYISVVANVAFLVARYYLLHGLLSLGWVAYLH